MNIDLLSILNNAEQITLFRHEHPDCDAYGAVFSLASFIRDNFPGKPVRCLGNDVCTQGKWPMMDEASDAFIENSVAIVLDCANKERVDDARFVNAKTIIKIDHHPNHDSYGSLEHVDPLAAATCEILTFFYAQAEAQGYIFSKTTATYAYKGLLTDSLCFRTSNTTTNTLLAASILTKKGLPIAEINRELFDVSLERFQLENYITSHARIIDGKLAVVILGKDVLNHFGVTASEARNCIDCLGHVKEFEIWAIFTEKEEEGNRLYDGSLRAKTAVINTIAQNYNGGGHPLAAGVKNLTDDSLSELLNALKNA